MEATTRTNTVDTNHSLINESVDDEQNLTAQESRIWSDLVSGFYKSWVVCLDCFQKNLQICRDSKDLQGEHESCDTSLRPWHQWCHGMSDVPSNLNEGQVPLSKSSEARKRWVFGLAVFRWHKNHFPIKIQRGATVHSKQVERTSKGWVGWVCSDECLENSLRSPICWLTLRL